MRTHEGGESGLGDLGFPPGTGDSQLEPGSGNHVTEPRILFGTGYDLKTKTTWEIMNWGCLILSYSLGKSHISVMFILSIKTNLMPQMISSVRVSLWTCYRFRARIIRHHQVSLLCPGVYCP